MDKFLTPLVILCSMTLKAFQLNIVEAETPKSPRTEQFESAKPHFTYD